MTRARSATIVDVMSDEQQQRADTLLEQALSTTGTPDPRPVHRERLRELREADRAAYEGAVGHYRSVVLPAIADGSSDPVAAWTGYGQYVANLLAPGRTVTIDASGRSAPYEPPADPGHLVLHLPDDPRRKALAVAMPPAATPAQRATHDWLVTGRTSLADAS